ncbi:MAG: hypothetical protein WCA20_10330 [Candidatus Sulfotelmatobacter sp.]
MAHQTSKIVRKTINSTFYWTLNGRADFFAISCSPGIELEDDLATYSHRHRRPVFSSFHGGLSVTGQQRDVPGDLERQIEAFIEHYNHRRTLHSPGHG